jgi:hypothetical protein
MEPPRRAAQRRSLGRNHNPATKEKWPMAHTFMPGTETWYASDSPTNSFSAIFEDDQDTGYLYAYDRANSEKPILDAVHVYNVAAVKDKNVESAAEILWSTDGLKAALLINRYPHAVINFTECCSYCRTGFPPPPNGWKRGTWDEKLMNLFERSA